MMRIRFFLRMARARQTSCRWPMLKFDPDSASSVSSLAGNSSTAAFSWTFEQTKHRFTPRAGLWDHLIMYYIYNHHGNPLGKSSHQKTDLWTRLTKIYMVHHMRIVLNKVLHKSNNCDEIEIWRNKLHEQHSETKKPTDFRTMQLKVVKCSFLSFGLPKYIILAGLYNSKCFVCVCVCVHLFQSIP